MTVSDVGVRNGSCCHFGHEIKILMLISYEELYLIL